MRMDQEAQYVSLAFETSFALFAYEREVEKLHRDSPLDSPPQPTAAHPAVTDLRYEPVVPKGLPCQCSCTGQFDRPRLEETFLDQSTMLLEKCFQMFHQGGVLGAQGG